MVAGWGHAATERGGSGHAASGHAASEPDGSGPDAASSPDGTLLYIGACMTEDSADSVVGDSVVVVVAGAVLVLLFISTRLTMHGQRSVA